MLAESEHEIMLQLFSHFPEPPPPPPSLPRNFKFEGWRCFLFARELFRSLITITFQFFPPGGPRSLDIWAADLFLNTTNTITCGGPTTDRCLRSGNKALNIKANSTASVIF